MGSLHNTTSDIFSSSLCAVSVLCAFSERETCVSPPLITPRDTSDLVQVDMQMFSTCHQQQDEKEERTEALKDKFQHQNGLDCENPNHLEYVRRHLPWVQVQQPCRQHRHQEITEVTAPFSVTVPAQITCLALKRHIE